MYTKLQCNSDRTGEVNSAQEVLPGSAFFRGPVFSSEPARILADLRLRHRLDMLHHATSLVLEGALHVVELPAKLDRILDIGTGTYTFFHSMVGHLQLTAL